MRFLSNFHSLKCPAESGKSIREEVYFQDENSEPFDEACFELDKERLEGVGDIIEFFADLVMQNFILKHLVKGDSSLGLFVWKGGRYYPCEEKIKAWLEEASQKAGLSDKVRVHVVNEVLEKVKRRMFFELKEEPLKIVIRNCALGWRAFLEGDFERALIPA